jgi:hypothetical protein
MDKQLLGGCISTKSTFGGFYSIDVDKVVNGKGVDVMDDVIVSTIQNKYGDGILECKFGIYGDYIDYRKSVNCRYYFKVNDRILLIESCRITTPLEYLGKYWYLFKETKWLERNGFIDGKYIPIHFLLIFRRNDGKKMFCSEYKQRLCSYIGEKINDDLPNQPFLYHSLKYDGDDLELRRMLEIITL